MTTGPAIRDAATVALLRDGAQGLEVLLLRRDTGHVFAPGAYVFPGGALDAGDGDPALAAHCVATGSDACSSGEALVFRMSAIRECFEEAGLLAGLSGDCACADSVLAAERVALNAGACAWSTVVERLDLAFDLSRLVYFAYFLTPPGAPRRYATRFFVIRAPAGQTASCDGHETDIAWWAGPSEALALCEQGDISLLPPTRITLMALAEYNDVDQALAGLPRQSKQYGAMP